MEETCILTVPAKVVIQQSPPLPCLGLWNMKHELGEPSVVDCGEHGGETPQLEYQSCYLRMETPFCGYRLIWLGQMDLDHTKAARNVSDLEDYMSYECNHRNRSTTRRSRQWDLRGEGNSLVRPIDR